MELQTQGGHDPHDRRELGVACRRKCFVEALAAESASRATRVMPWARARPPSAAATSVESPS